MSYYKRRHRKVNATLIVCYIESILTFTQASNSTATLKTESIIYRKNAKYRDIEMSTGGQYRLAVPVSISILPMFLSRMIAAWYIIPILGIASLSNG